MKDRDRNLSWPISGSASDNLDDRLHRFQRVATLCTSIVRYDKGQAKFETRGSTFVQKSSIVLNRRSCGIRPLYIQAKITGSEDALGGAQADASRYQRCRPSPDRWTINRPAHR